MKKIPDSQGNLLDKTIIASPYTRTFWIEYKLNPKRSDYNIVFEQSVEGKLDVSRLQKAFIRMVQENVLLNSHLMEKDEILYWEINDVIHPLAMYENLKKQEEFVTIPFNLEAGPLYRFGLFKNTDDSYELLIVLHHAVIDGTSFDEFYDLVTNYYNDNSYTGESLKNQVQDITKMNRLFYEKVLQLKRMGAGNFWEEKCKNIPASNSLTNHIKSKKKSKKSNHIKSIDFKVVLNSLATPFDSKFNLFISVWGALIAKYSNVEHIFIGYPMSIKKGSYFKYGGYINVLVFPIDISNSRNINDLYQSGLALKDDLYLNKENKHSYLPSYEIFRSSGISSLNTLFGQTNLKNKIFQFKNCKSRPNSKFRIDIAGNEIVLEYEEVERTYNFRLRYDSNLFDYEAMRQLAKHFQILLKITLKNPNQPLNSIEFLTGKEYQKIMYDWNKTGKPYPQDKTIHQLFEEQVGRTPNRIAVVCGDKELTYAQLNAKSNQLARYIQKIHSQQKGKELKPDTLIALCVNRSLDMIIGIFGILKAGAAYVPIDPNFPCDRLVNMLFDTGATLCLTKQALWESLALNAPKVTPIHLDQQPYSGENAVNLADQIHSSALAYVIYTSGTTGSPKGVMIPHHNVINLCESLTKKYSLKKDEVILQFSNYTFDTSILQITLALLKGHALLLLENKLWENRNEFYKYLQDNRVTHIHATPSFLEQYDFSEVKTLKRIISGGERLSTRLIKKLSTQAACIINQYGPTETTVVATLNAHVSTNNNSIGTPIANTKVYVLDKNLHILPIGVLGELYIGGAGLARGYLNRPELTAEKFIENPFASAADKKKGYTHLYKTGDLVRWLPDGNLEYIGRDDFQVKIRGFRIECGEIETALLQCPDVTQAVVVALEREGGSYLAAYYVSAKALGPNHLKDHLNAVLPNYMIPSVFVSLESLPLTSSGKIDRKALPKPEFQNQANEYLAPRTELEYTLCDIWQKLLNIEHIGIVDDFFALGGDSILSIQLSSQLRAHNLHCSAKDIFECRTIKQLATRLHNNQQEVLIQAEQGVLSGEFKLLPIQQWFFAQGFAKPNHWNQSFLIKVPPLDVEKLKTIPAQLASQHDVLRLIFRKGHQTYQKKMMLPDMKILNKNKLSDFELEELFTQWQSDFDLTKGPLWRMAYVWGYEDGSARIYFALHHLLVDVVSWRILLTDIEMLYQGRALAAKTSSYRQWVDCLETYPKKYADERVYWQSEIQSLTQYPHVLNERVVQSIRFNQKTTHSLLQKANEAYHTEINDLLLTALAISLEKLFGVQRPSITLEGHGRESIVEYLDVSNTLGWFTTVFPVNLPLKGALGASIKSIKEHLRGIPNKGIGYGAFLYAKDGDLSAHKLPPITFSYLGQLDRISGSWEIAAEPSGLNRANENQQDQLIVFNGAVMEEQLEFTIESDLGKELTQELANLFKQSLNEIVDHCVHFVKQHMSDYTPSDFPTVNISQALLDRLQKQYAIQAIYPANSLQQGFIYHALSHRDDDAYRVQELYDYQGELDVQLFREAWQHAIQTFPILRACFNWEEEMIQIIARTADMMWVEKDLSQYADPDAELQKLQAQDRLQDFDLSKPCLMRMMVLKRGSKEYTFLLTIHHSIIDGWSKPILWQYVQQVYHQLCMNQVVHITEEQTYLNAQAHYAQNHVAAEAILENKTQKVSRAK